MTNKPGLPIARWTIAATVEDISTGVTYAGLIKSALRAIEPCIDQVNRAVKKGPAAPSAVKGRSA